MHDLNNYRLLNVISASSLMPFSTGRVSNVSKLGCLDPTPKLFSFKVNMTENRN